MTARKLKISVTLSADLVRRIDQKAGKAGTRSGVIERWLQRAARLEAEREVDEATAAYYESLTADDVAEEEALARSLSRASRKLEVDQPARGRRSRG